MIGAAGTARAAVARSAAALTALAAPAAAACPDAADLARGVELVMAGPITFTARAPGLIEAYQPGGDADYATWSRAGVVPLRHVIHEPDGTRDTIEIAWDADPMALPDPRPGTSWHLRGRYPAVAGQAAQRIALAVDWGAAETVALGGCTTAAVVGDFALTYEGEGWTDRRRVVWLAAPGFAVEGPAGATAAEVVRGRVLRPVP